MVVELEQQREPKPVLGCLALQERVVVRQQRPSLDQVVRTHRLSHSNPSACESSGGFLLPARLNHESSEESREKELGAPIHPIPALQIMPTIKFGLQSSTRNQSRPDKDTVMGNTSFVILLVAGLALVARGVLANLLDTRVPAKELA